MFSLGLGLLWLAARNPDRAVDLFDRTIGRWLPHRFSERASQVASAFVAGLGALARPGVFLRALFWSFIVWIDLALSIWAGIMAFGITGPGVSGSFFLQSVIAFAVAAPSSPGFFGVFEAAARLGLSLWSVTPARIVSFATSYHILTFIPVTVLGLWYLQRIGLSWKDVGGPKEDLGSTDPEPASPSPGPEAST